MPEIVAATDKHPSLPAHEDTVSEKLFREAELLWDGTKRGVSKSATEAWNHPGSTLLKFGGAAAVGAGLVLLNGRAGMCRLTAQVVGGALGMAFLTDVSGRAYVTGSAVADTWRTAERLERNKRIVADTVGPFVVDTAIMTAGGVAGAGAARIPTVKNAFNSTVDNFYSRVPSRVFRRESEQLSLLEQYHPGTAQHTRRVGELSTLIAEEMNLPRSSRVTIEHAAKMHDIGKLDVSVKILDKAGKPTDTELGIIKTHTETSFQRLTALQYPSRYADVPSFAASHHEMLNGKGYPKGLSGSEIPLESRIISVADSFDTMTSNRSYRSRISMPEVFSELRKNSGTQFDPKVVDAILRIRADKIARIISAGEGGESLPSLTPLQKVTLGDLLDPAKAGKVDPDAVNIFKLIYRRNLSEPKR